MGSKHVGGALLRSRPALSRHNSASAPVPAAAAPRGGFSPGSSPWGRSSLQQHAKALRRISGVLALPVSPWGEGPAGWEPGWLSWGLCPQQGGLGWNDVATLAKATAGGASLNGVPQVPNTPSCPGKVQQGGKDK